MRGRHLLLVLLTAAAAALLSSCSSVNNASNSNQGGNSTPAKATPVITWSQPAAIDTQTPLSSAQLDATANVPWIRQET